MSSSNAMKMSPPNMLDYLRCEGALSDRMKAKLTDRILNDAMLLLADAGAIFMGQGVAYPGHSMFKDLEGVPMEQRLELPVMEEMQLGMATGMAMEGLLPVCIYPRMDFMLRAMDQLVSHLDKIAEMSCGQWQPKVIIRTRVGTTKPLNAGPQHVQNHLDAFRRMLTNINSWQINEPGQIAETYEMALKTKHSSLIVEAFGC